MKKLTPIKSIRKYCLWCCIGSRMEIKLCPVYKCPIYRYRMGGKLDLQALIKLNPEANKEENKKDIISNFHLGPVKAIRKKCWYCSTYSTKEIKNCEHTDCQQFLYRMGTNPSRKGIGGNSNLNPKKGYSASENNIVDRSVI
jgi:hypothetical protein